MENEIWKDIPGYENHYQVSNIGNVKSLKYRNTNKHKYLKPSINQGYKQVVLSKDGKLKTHLVHSLVAIAFLNHKPNGITMVVDHINNNPTDNRVENLQIVTHRHNCSKDKKGISIHTGVSRIDRIDKWVAGITVNNKRTHLGSFQTEEEASQAYKLALQNLK